MSRKLSTLIGLMLLLSMILGACAQATAEVDTQAPVAATEAPAPTQVPPTEVPTAVPTQVPPPDTLALFTDLVSNLNPDNGYSAVAAAKLNEALVEKPPFLLDVREAAELEKDGFIAGAVNIPVREVLVNLDKLPGLDEPIVIYCGSGHRGALTMSALKLLGYTDVRNLAGGLGGWKKAGFAVETGPMPEAAQSISTAIIADQALYELLNSYFTSMPDSFYATNAAKLSEDLTAATAPFILDVRTAEEQVSEGYIEGAVNIPMAEFFSSLENLPAQDTPIVVYCRTGHRAAVMTMALQMLGYENVTNLGGGLNAWKAAQMPVAGWVDWQTVWSEYLTSLPEGFYTIKPADLNTALTENPPFVLDVREAKELEDEGFIPGAVNIPVREVSANLDKLPGLETPIVVYCRTGHRAAIAMAALQQFGYKDVKNLAGGMNAWKKAELEVVTGQMPEAPIAGVAPEVDATRLRDLSKFMTELPEGFFTVVAPDLQVELTASEPPFLLDLRTPEEVATGYIEGSTPIAIQDVPANLDKLPAKDKPIVVLCQSGHRGALVMTYLRMTGYTNVRNLAGGMNAWLAAELPVAN